MKMRVLPLVVIGCIGLLALGGCQASAKIGNAEPQAATPPPPPPAPPPPAPAPAPAIKASKEVKAMGKAKIVNNEIQIPGKIQFDFDKATIKDDKDTKEILDTLYQVMKENPHITKLRIEGHTDDKGALDHNQKLSQERADSVSKWLQTKGIESARLTTIGFGPTKPLVANDNEQHREQNRRTEFKIWELEGKPTDAQKAESATPTASGGGGGAGSAMGAAGKAGATPAGTAKPAKK